MHVPSLSAGRRRQARRTPPPRLLMRHLATATRVLSLSLRSHPPQTRRAPSSEFEVTATATAQAHAGRRASKRDPIRLKVDTELHHCGRGNHQTRKKLRTREVRQAAHPDRLLSAIRGSPVPD